VVTDVGDCANIVGKTGKVVPVGEMYGFASQVIDVLSKSRLRRGCMGKSARARVKELYNIENVAFQYKELYERHRAKLKTRN